MDQSYLFEPIPCDKYNLLTKKEVIELNKCNEDLIRQMRAHIEKLELKITEKEQKSFSLGEELINIKSKYFGKSSEKSSTEKAKRKAPKSPGKRVLLPSDRYPNLDIIEKRVTLDNLPACPCCNEKMQDSGMSEDSEYLTVIPKQYYIVKQKRVKYKCSSCHGPLVTTPAIPRIKKGGSYSDEMTVDVAMSKYLELTPVERYASIAKREGVKVSANSLIELTHSLSSFLVPVYEKIKDEILSSEILHADETPHRMLEGDKKSNWFFWGFSNEFASYFDARDTRSGDVAVEILKDSKCEYLSSDVFSGYSKAVNETNKVREGPKLQSIFCNAHARRKFKESEKNFDDSEFFLRCYRRIYKLDKTDLDTRRSWQRLYMRAMLIKSDKIIKSFPPKSSIGKALIYFSKNFDGLVRFTSRNDLPIDNNAQERQLRSPVVGRKTWYGTHSKKGAKTASILFSIVESCKLNCINPRDYLRDLIKAMHESRPVFTPFEFAKKKNS